MAKPAVVRFPTRQMFGAGDGVTLSVVSDMARKSPTTIRMTMSNGVSTACPVMTRPTTRSTLITIFLTIEFNV